VSADADSGAYRLHIVLRRPAIVTAGALGRRRLEPGHYVYVGSARRALSKRVERHRRLAREKQGRRHWHIDGLLLHRFSRLVEAELLPGAEECLLSHALGIQSGVTVPVPGFGATDCRAGCPAHLYRVGPPPSA